MNAVPSGAAFFYESARLQPKRAFAIGAGPGRVLERATARIGRIAAFLIKLLEPDAAAGRIMPISRPALASAIATGGTVGTARLRDRRNGKGEPGRQKQKDERAGGHGVKGLRISASRALP